MVFSEEYDQTFSLHNTQKQATFASINKIFRIKANPI